METIYDIICDKRTTAREIRSGTTHQYGLELANMLESEADRIEAAHKREIAAKDAENARLRKLVGELADSLDSFRAWRGRGALVARARGVAK